ncbi:hypothetical protein BJX64DRAFT_291145 [Aspergillus heterothallicus]
MGALLGVGHSVLQGEHGFAVDNLVFAKLVLDNGTVVTASVAENEDLFWSLRGAGDNFGTVIKTEIKAFDIHPDLWICMPCIYKAEKVGGSFEARNELGDIIREPGLIVLNGYYRNLPGFGTDKVMTWPNIPS